MLPQTEEDKLKSRIYKEVVQENHLEDKSEYLKVYEKRYEQEKNNKAKEKFHFFKRYSLEEGLINLANEYNKIPDIKKKKKRKIDWHAYRLIKRCSICKKDKEITRYYYKMYKQMKSSYLDFSKGIGYIEDQKEDYMEEDYASLEKALEIES